MTTTPILTVGTCTSTSSYSLKRFYDLFKNKKASELIEDLANKEIILAKHQKQKPVTDIRESNVNDIKEKMLNMISKRGSRQEFEELGKALQREAVYIASKLPSVSSFAEIPSDTEITAIKQLLLEKLDG